MCKWLQAVRSSSAAIERWFEDRTLSIACSSCLGLILGISQRNSRENSRRGGRRHVRAASPSGRAGVMKKRGGRTCCEMIDGRRSRKMSERASGAEGTAGYHTEGVRTVSMKRTKQKCLHPLLSFRLLSWVHASIHFSLFLMNSEGVCSSAATTGGWPLNRSFTPACLPPFLTFRPRSLTSFRLANMPE